MKKRSLIQFLLLLCLPLLHTGVGSAHSAHALQGGYIFEGSNRRAPFIIGDPRSAATHQGSEKLKAVEFDEDDDTDKKPAGEGRGYFCSYYEPSIDGTSLYLSARFLDGRRIPRYTSPHYIIHKVLRI